MVYYYNQRRAPRQQQQQEEEQPPQKQRHEQQQQQQQQLQSSIAHLQGNHHQPRPTHHEQQQKQQQRVQQQHHRSGRSGEDPQDRAAMALELRRQKEKFLLFTRLLIRYLEQKDPSLHQQAKAIIKDCADRNRRQERGYESVTAAMKERLKALVGDTHWRKTEMYLKHLLEQKKKQQASQAAGDPSSRPQKPQQAAREN